MVKVIDNSNDKILVEMSKSEYKRYFLDKIEKECESSYYNSCENQGVYFGKGITPDNFIKLLELLDEGRRNDTVVPFFKMATQIGKKPLTGQL